MGSERVIMSERASELPQPTGAADTAHRRGHLELAGIHKRFGGVRALRGADLRISKEGIVHGLVGENGSGKSTLLGVLSGQLPSDEGQISIRGAPVSFANPTAALRTGIAMVAQET